MKIWVVTRTDWDTEGSSWTEVVGVFSSMDKVPERYKTGNTYRDYDIVEKELDHEESW